jgi:LysR family hydrogen peroxide-inducible transcriptional activator
MVSLKQLRYFDALAAAGHFGRAAQNSGISQPALSMQIRDLEKTLGGALIERTGGGAHLTQLGSEVASRAARILAAVSDLEGLAHVQGAVLAGHMRLGVIPSIAPYLLPGLLSLAQEQYPDLRLLVRETITETLVDELTAGSLDAIVASLPLDAAELVAMPVFEDPFLLAVRAGSPHAARSPAMTDLISADELLLLEDGHCLRDQALEVCHAIDPRRLRSFGATSLATLLQLVAAGHGVTLVPQLAVNAGVPLDERVRLIRFAEPEPKRTVAVAWRRNSPRERDFGALAELVSACAGHGTAAEACP